MKFGEISVAGAEGSILAHSVRHGGGMFKKGRVLTADDVAMLTAAGISRVFAARLGDDDVPEDVAASAVADVAGGAGTMAQAPFTGRANLLSHVHGLALVDGGRVRALNRLHESLTLATVAPHTVVEKRQIVATVKVIPFAVPREVLAKALGIIANEPLVRVEAFKHRKVGLVITKVPQTKPSLIAKSEVAMRERITALDGELALVMTVEHAIEPVRAAIVKMHGRRCHPILVFGASAIVDRGDIIPMAVVAAGGEVVHLGMPVDPGNLMMYGKLEGVPVIGVPSCARSPKLNGFDWVLERAMAGVQVTASDIMDMGAGGLLAEIPTRPLPREGKPKVQKAPRIAALVLAAGKSARMGSNKLLADLNGVALVRRTVEAVASWPLGKVIVVTGHEADRVRAALDGLDVTLAHNADYALGLATSLRRGLEAVAEDADGLLVCLGDMPLVEADIVRRLIAAFNPANHRTICVPVHGGIRGNPVLWGRAHFAAMAALSGDRGAKGLMEQFAEEVVEIETSHDGVMTDADTPDALARLRSRSAP
ncbi:MAG: NTP transferase domain-containing protein [Rhizobiales bacterium]|nr:NTP transferase domain-containing protein [Hyphomicrobiales bacterium]